VDIGLAVGMTAEEVAAIEKQDISASCFNERDQAVLAFGREVIVNVQVPQAIFDRAKAHLSEQAMVDAIVDIGFYMTLARVTEAFDIDADPPQGRDIIKSLER
jgi:alkylhydroperoxidase family enzyme